MIRASGAKFQRGDAFQRLSVPLKEEFTQRITQVAANACRHPALGDFMLKTLQDDLPAVDIIRIFEHKRAKPALWEDYTFERGGIDFIELVTLREERLAPPLRKHTPHVQSWTALCQIRNRFQGR
jgi:hypothetical protein